MSSFLYVNDEEAQRKINIDDLYAKKQQKELKQLSIFNKLLNRIHKRITITGKNKPNDKHIWFIVPEYIFGEPIYDQGDCLGYLVAKLEENGFFVKYVHPNALFVSWMNWVPSYVRSEFRKQTGCTIDEKGNIVSRPEDKTDDTKLLNEKQNTNQKEQKQFTPIGQYKPTVNLVYNN
jgi:hypothetical protein